MRKSTWVVALACAVATLTAAAQTATTAAEKGKIVVSSNGSRLGTVYRVGPDGSAQIIIDGKLVSIPASTLSNVDGKLTTSLSKSEVLALR
jgi:hypothetical protein